MTAVTPELLTRFDVPGPPIHLLSYGRPVCGGFWSGELRLGVGPKAFGNRLQSHAVVAVCAHPILRVAMLLLRLQQDHYQTP